MNFIIATEQARPGTGLLHCQHWLSWVAVENIKHHYFGIGHVRHVLECIVKGGTDKHAQRAACIIMDNG